MPDQAQVGLGTVLEFKIGSGSFVPLSTLIDIDPPDMMVKIASYQPLSVPSAARIKLAASLETGDTKFTVVHGVGLSSTLQALRQANNLTWQIVLADGTTTETFNGIIKKISRKYKCDEVDVIDVELETSGDVTLG